MSFVKLLRAPFTVTTSRLLRPSFTTMTRSFSSFTITPTELAAELQNPARSSRIIPVSAEWYLPNDPRNGYEEYTKARIPGARFFDLDAIKDPHSPYPHMLPDGETFAKAMGELGIARDDTVVVYDSPHVGIFSGPRAAWTFRVFGHVKVHLLNNFKVWVEKGFPVESGEVERWEETNYPVVQPDRSIVVDFEEMVKRAQEGKKDGLVIVDARPKGRFDGKDPEPRPGLPSGHIPGSISIPFSELVDPTTKTLKSAEKLQKLFAGKGIDSSPNTEKILMCGTGVTAVVVNSALELAGVKGKLRVYDGSWTEWAQRVDEKSGLIVKTPQ